MKPWRLAAVLAAVLLTMAGAASADVAFPARLDVVEQDEGVFEITFTLPIVEGRKLRAEPRMPPTCVESTPRESGASAGGFTSTWTVECQPASLAGEAILIEGLLGTQTDLAFTLNLRDGRSYSRILRPSRPGFLVPEKPSKVALATEAIISGLRRTVRHLSLWLVIAVAALLGQRPRALVTAAGAYALGHFAAQWLGGQGWLEVTPLVRDLLVWTTVAVPVIRLADGGESWRDWLQPLWPTCFFIGMLFGGARPEALPTEGLSNAEQMLALILFSVGSGAAVLLMTAAAHELTVLFGLAAGGRWGDAGNRVAGYLIGSLAVAMVVALLVGMWIGGGDDLRAPLEFALLAAVLGPSISLIGRKSGVDSVAFATLAIVGTALGLARIPLPAASLLTLGSLLVLGAALAVARPLGSSWALAVAVVAVPAHSWATAEVLVENVSRSTAVTFGAVLVAVCVFHASLVASRDLRGREPSLPVRLLGAFVAVLAVTWRLAEYRAWFEREVATEAALGLARLPLLSIGLLIVAVIWWMRGRGETPLPEAEQRPRGLHRLAFVGAFLLLPYGTLAVPNPFFAAYAPRGDGARLIMSKVLSDTYQALNIEDEEELYDALAESVTGNLIGDLYLDNRRRLTTGTRQGTEVTIRGVSVLGIGEPTEVAAAEGGYSYDCQWAVVARVQHLQHVHHRRQIYGGVLTLRAEEGRWKVAGVELHSEDRVVLPWEPT
jgi:hydrogenase/urease accessory protein HupE